MRHASQNVRRTGASCGYRRPRCPRWSRWRCVVRSTVRGSQGRPRRARVYVCAVQGNFSDSVPVLPPRRRPRRTRERSRAPAARARRAPVRFARYTMCISFKTDGSSFGLGRATRSLLRRSRSRETLTVRFSGNEKLVPRRAVPPRRPAPRGAACFDDATNGMGRDARGRARPRRPPTPPAAGPPRVNPGRVPACSPVRSPRSHPSRVLYGPIEGRTR